MVATIANNGNIQSLFNGIAIILAGTLTTIRMGIANVKNHFNGKND